MTDRPAPLDHLTILDLTQQLAGPYASQILADLGARVIKIEPPSGDPTRSVAPYFRKGESAYFLAVNRNKESVVIDLKTVGGRNLLLDLAAHADVVIENLRPGVTERLGISYDQLSARNPRLVMCSISGFGQDGPYRDRPAFDIIVQALSGGMSITGEVGGRPLRAGIPLGDLAGGMFGAIGTLAAVADAQRSGNGRHVDISMLDGQISMLSYIAAYYFVGGVVAGPQGRAHLSIPTYRSYQCGDNVEVVVAANTERMWCGLCRALGRADLIDEPRFKLNEDRLRHRADLDILLESAFSLFGSDELLGKLEAEGVPSAPINPIDRALADPQVGYRHMVLQVPDADGVPLSFVGNPIKISDHEERAGYPPGLGQHTRSVIRELLGLDDSDLDLLEASRAIASGASTLPPGATIHTADVGTGNATGHQASRTPRVNLSSKMDDR
jgi:crotonobetainyl-CoA:carnitine CoA-transferase CaiB-like acyl-CoA transferase